MKVEFAFGYVPDEFADLETIRLKLGVIKTTTTI